jgi:proline dehydrogenase
MSKDQVLNFDNTEKAFAYKSNGQLKKARFLFSAMQFAPLVKIGTVLTPWAIKSGLPVKGIIKTTLFEQFVGGESLENTDAVLNMLDGFKVQVILDYGVEGGEHSDEKYDQEVSTFMKVLSFSATRKNIPFISIKVTGLSSTLLLEKLNVSIGKNSSEKLEIALPKAIATLDKEDQHSWNRLLIRTEKICSHASTLGVGVMIDAEESWIQDPIDYISYLMMEKFNKEKVVVYNTIQLYRSDRLSFLKSSYAHAESNGYLPGLKLVRGAYMEKERKRAAELGYPSPIQIDKSATDADYNQALSIAFEKINSASVIVASHNEKSSLLAAELASNANVSTNHPHLHFSQLYGMSDNLTFNLADAGFNVSKYLPFGPVDEVIPYLMRRAQENSSVSGQTSRELQLLNKECKRRGI